MWKHKVSLNSVLTAESMDLILHMFGELQCPFFSYPLVFDDFADVDGCLGILSEVPLLLEKEALSALPTQIWTHKPHVYQYWLNQTKRVCMYMLLSDLKPSSTYTLLVGDLNRVSNSTIDMSGIDTNGYRHLKLADINTITSLISIFC